MTIVILVAGSGRRFRDKKPKSLSMVKDRSLLQRTLEQIRTVKDNSNKSSYWI